MKVLIQIPERADALRRLLKGPGTYTLHGSSMGLQVALYRSALADGSGVLITVRPGNGTHTPGSGPIRHTRKIACLWPVNAVWQMLLC